MVILPGRPGSAGTRIDLSTQHTYSDEPLSMHFVLSGYTQHAEWYNNLQVAT